MAWWKVKLNDRDKTGFSFYFTKTERNPHPVIQLLLLLKGASVLWGGVEGVVCTCVSVSLCWVDGMFCEQGHLARCQKCLMGNRKEQLLVQILLYLFSYTIKNNSEFVLNPHVCNPTLLSPAPPPPYPQVQSCCCGGGRLHCWGRLSSTSGMLTRNLRSSLSTVMVSLPLLFSTRCLVSSRDRSPWSCHWSGQRKQIDQHTVTITLFQTLHMAWYRRWTIYSLWFQMDQSSYYLENEVPLLQCAFLWSQARFCHVLDKDLTPSFNPYSAERGRWQESRPTSALQNC